MVFGRIYTSKAVKGLIVPTPAQVHKWSRIWLYFIYIGNRFITQLY